MDLCFGLNPSVFQAFDVIELVKSEEFFELDVFECI